LIVSSILGISSIMAAAGAGLLDCLRLTTLIGEGSH
jgi:hypothetical protein